MYLYYVQPLQSLTYSKKQPLKQQANNCSLAHEIYKIHNFQVTLLKIKVLQDTIEEPFCLNGSIKNL